MFTRQFIVYCGLMKQIPSPMLYRCRILTALPMLLKINELTQSLLEGIYVKLEITNSKKATLYKHLRRYWHGGMTIN